MSRLLALLLAGCTLETEGLEDLASEPCMAEAQCDEGTRVLAVNRPELVEGWTCETSQPDTRLRVRCELGPASFSVFCDPQADVRTSTVQVGQCVIQVWCNL